jgi:hypothetical protein
MARKFTRFAFFGLVFLLLSAREGCAAGSALVVLYDDFSRVYERTAVLQHILGREYGFDDVSIEINLLPREVPARVRRFLTTPRQPNERRFVWVSGPRSHAAHGVCPNAGTKPVRPSAPTVMLAPNCYLSFLRVDGLIRHLPTAPIWVHLDAAPPPLSVALKRGTLAFISLPNDQAEAVTNVDQLLVDTFRTLRGQAVSPAYLLQVLRHGFMKDGSDFTPRLTVAPARSAWATNLLAADARPFAPGGGRQLLNALAGSLKTLEGDPARLYSKPDLAAPTVTSLSPRQRVLVLRHDRTGRMAFVKTVDGNFGWVMLEAGRAVPAPQ